MQPQRIPSGIPGLDEILHGGFIPGRSYLIVGSPGTGKTIFSLQWLLEGTRRNETSLYITLTEPLDAIKANMTAFDWSLDGLKTLDLSSGRDLKEEDMGEYHIFPPSEVEQVPVWQNIYRAVQEIRPSRLVIDSATQLRHLSTDEYQFRKHILTFINHLYSKGCTTLLTFEPTEMDRESSMALAVDGIIKLRNEISSQRLIGIRTLEVDKIRGSDFISGLHFLRIVSEGIVVFPHKIEEQSMAEHKKNQLSSNIEALDDLLGGGIEKGTTTLITGPSGVGKSLLATQFLVSTASSGSAVSIYTFEEPAFSMIERCRSVRMHVDPLIDSGRLQILHINPLEYHPDEFLHIVRKDVEERGIEAIVIDSMRGYQLAMEQFGNIVGHTQNLINYLHGKGVTCFLVNELEQVTGDLKISEIGISYLVDNAILLRYAESGGRIIRVIGCLKKRLGKFQQELRELSITDEGLKVGGMLKGFQGLLTGIPQRMDV